MKRIRIAFAAVAVACSASAYAMPPQVPQTYYDHLPHRWDVLSGNPGFCGMSHIGPFAPICWDD
jgi:hypothetical protein